MEEYAGGRREDRRGGAAEFLRSLRPLGSNHSHIMDLKVVLLGVCLYALVVTYSQAGIPKCCVSTKSDIPPRILARVQRWDVQQSNGACDVPALILHVKHFRRPICAHPKVMRMLLGVLNRKKRSHHRESY